MKRRLLLTVGLTPLIAQGLLSPVHAASEPASLKFAELYKSRTVLGMDTHSSLFMFHDGFKTLCGFFFCVSFLIIFIFIHFLSWS